MSLQNAFETGRLYLPLRDLADAAQELGDAYSAFMLLPGLRSFWPTSVHAASGELADLAGGSTYRLFLSGAPVYNGLGAPYIEFDGTSDYAYLTDTSLHDILGTESYIDTDVQGLTLGGWFYHNSLTGAQAYISKYGNAGNISYAIRKIGGHQIQVSLSSDGSALINTNGPSAAVETWHFVVGRFTAGVERSIFVDGEKTSEVTAVTSIFNSSAELRIGENVSSTSRKLNGRASLCFLCATALSDGLIDDLFQITRDLYGV